jgi:hypothetical protein
MSDLDALTESERDALSQLQAITNGADVDTQISLLQSVNWDVQVRTFVILSIENGGGPASFQICHVPMLTCPPNLWTFGLVFV